MTTVALGPYEHRGAYIGSELFDTDGTPRGFCPDCEHAPCIAAPGASALGHCWKSPRWISMDVLVEEIRTLWLDANSQSWAGWTAIAPAIHSLSSLATVSDDHTTKKCTVRALVDVRQQLREQVQS